MPRKMRAHVSITTNYLFEFNVPDDYDILEKYMLASDYFEAHNDQKDEWIVDGDFQVDTVEEVVQ